MDDTTESGVNKERLENQIDKQPDVPRFLADLIALNSSKLTEADARLLEVLMSDPVRAAMENGKEVSSRAGVHPASAVRLARRLGFAGYPEFRTFLQNNLVDTGTGDFENPAARMAARLIRAEEGKLLSTILDSEIAALQQVRTSVSDTDIRAFSEVLRDARRIFVLGRSHAAALSSLIALRLRRSGYDATDLSSQLHILPEMLSILTDKDVVWLLSFRSPSPVIVDIRGAAALKGAKTLILSDVNGARIDPPGDFHISVSRGGVGQSQSLVVPMTIANAIILDLASIDEGKSLSALDRFKAFRASLPPRLSR
ncbi:MurR/RpiR family transcriptional regulator [Limoniibacter endophyticus]|uniref:RpiR family transcriptional regulator n=1 Tax=Limoniibacter endophyticus TaxID=1565040 RepID=A0A8J3GHM2_9HYPH|nr:MurR/RpiR family transcriptional regulator [Limoniibacter endophyticus]GHC73040.1 RpiR family transcriptional regulator [Limoniibacter endophyticus]